MIFCLVSLDSLKKLQTLNAKQCKRNLFLYAFEPTEVNSDLKTKNWIFEKKVTKALSTQSILLK